MTETGTNLEPGFIDTASRDRLDRFVTTRLDPNQNAAEGSLIVSVCQTLYCIDELNKNALFGQQLSLYTFLYGEQCEDFGVQQVGNGFTKNDAFAFDPLELTSDDDTYYGGSRGGFTVAYSGDDYLETYDRYPETRGER